jgi:hypothetical protein
VVIEQMFNNCIRPAFEFVKRLVARLLLPVAAVQLYAICVNIRDICPFSAMGLWNAENLGCNGLGSVHWIGSKFRLRDFKWEEPGILFLGTAISFRPFRS